MKEAEKTPELLERHRYSPRRRRERRWSKHRQSRGNIANSIDLHSSLPDTTVWYFARREAQIYIVLYQIRQFGILPEEILNHIERFSFCFGF
nr:hypothetical protein CFP56_60487 [Quercus suber]